MCQGKMRVSVLLFPLSRIWKTTVNTGKVIYIFKYLSVRWKRQSEHQMYFLRAAVIAYDKGASLAYEFDCRPQS